MLLFQSVRALALELLKLSKDIFNNSNTKMPLHPGCYCKKNLAICYSKFRYGLHNLKSLILFMLSLFSQLSLSLSNSLSLSLSRFWVSVVVVVGQFWVVLAVDRQ